MNSRVLTTAVLLATAAFFTSCLEEDVLGPDSPLTHQTLIAEMTGPAEAQQTKTCVDVRNPNTGFIGFLWQPEDEIGVYSQDGNSRNAQSKQIISMDKHIALPRLAIRQHFGLHLAIRVFGILNQNPRL